MKTCSKCKESLEEYLFYVGRAYKDGLVPACKFCCRKAAKKKYDANPNAQNKARALCAAWRDNNKEWRRFRHILNTYNLTLDQYYALEESQNFVCAICREDCDFHVDHNHKTEKVRGLLCLSCNMGLGNFKDSSSRMVEACFYLGKRGTYSAVSRDMNG